MMGIGIQIFHVPASARPASGTIAQDALNTRRYWTARDEGATLDWGLTIEELWP